MGNPAGLLLGAAVVAGVMLGFPAIALGLVAMLVVRLLGRTFSIWWAELLLLCLLLGAIRHPAIANRASGQDLARADRAIGVVDSLPVAAKRGDRLVFRVSQVRIEGEWVPANGNVLLYTFDDDRVTVDDRLEVVWDFTPIERMTPSSRGYVQSQDAIGTANVWSVHVTAPNHSLRKHLVSARRAIGQRVQEIVPGDAGALMTGIVTGDDSALSDAARAAFLATGTSHVTAVSGSNVAMLLALWERPFRWRTRRRNLLVQAGIILSVWLYAILTGLEPSALRAATVATLMILSGKSGRRADPMTVLVLASAGLLVWQPYLTRSVGFWLSVLASGALIGSFGNPGTDDWQGKLRSTVVGLIAVQFATLPVIVLIFGFWPPVSLLANLLLAPLMLAAFPVSFISSGVFFVPLVGRRLEFVPGVLCDISLSVVQRLESVIPPVSLDPARPEAALLLAVPCLAGLALVSKDVRRWAPRWLVMGNGRWREGFAMLAGFVAGGLLAVEIHRFFGG